MICVIDGCPKPVDRPSKGWCEAHYTPAGAATGTQHSRRRRQAA